MYIIKADAYGNGAVKIALEVEDKVDYFGVSSLDEALQLRFGGIKKPVFILGYTPAECAELLIEHNITQAVFSTEYAEKLSEFIPEDKKLKIHIKIDSGMSRLGFNAHDPANINKTCEEIFDLYKKYNNFIFEGIFTHFAVSDGNLQTEKDFTEKQFKNFMDVTEKLKQKGLNFPLRHVCNSAAVVNYPHMHLDMVRPGLILYGLYPTGLEDKVKQLGIKPVMQLKSVITQIKKLHKGDTVSYGRIYTAEKDITVATIPIGYADGFSRQLSNNGEILVNGKRAPIIGRICMDQFMADITGIDVKEGQTVTIIGKDGNDELFAEDIADRLNTINYEISTSISKRIIRLYLKNGEIVDKMSYII
jgi:alanine racemase